MNIQLSSKQAFVVWSLIITRDQPMMSKVKPSLSPGDRKTLVDTGLVTLEKRGQATHIMLTDKAWDWASEHYDVPFPSRTTAAVPVLQSLITVIGNSLQAHNLSLAEFFAPSPLSNNSVEQPVNDEQHLSLENAPHEQHIREAYAEADDGRGVGVRLAKFRQHLGAFDRATVDQLLRQMQLDRKLVLMRIEDPKAIAPEDEAAAVDIHGEKCHIIYLKD